MPTLIGELLGVAVFIILSAVILYAIEFKYPKR